MNHTKNLYGYSAIVDPRSREGDGSHWMAVINTRDARTTDRGWYAQACEVSNGQVKNHVEEDKAKGDMR